MNAHAQTAPERLITQNVVLTEEHKTILEELRFRQRLNFSEVVRRGIELVAEQYAQDQTTGAQLGA